MRISIYEDRGPRLLRAGLVSATGAFAIGLLAGCGADVAGGERQIQSIELPGPEPQSNIPVNAPELPSPTIPPCALRLPGCPSGELLVTGAPPTSLASNGNEVFWTIDPPPTSPPQPNVLKIAVTGGSPTALANDIHRAHSVVLDGSSLYWVLAAGPYDADASGVWSASQSGGNLTQLLNAEADSIGDAQIQALAVKVARGGFLLSPDVYFANEALSHLYDIYRPALFPGKWQADDLLPQIDPITKVFYYPESVTIDATNAYFVNDAGIVFVVRLSGGAATQLGYASVHSPIAVHGSAVYFVSGHAIVGVSVTAGANGSFTHGPPTTFAHDAGPPTTFASDSANLYWTCTACGTVSKASFAGGGMVNVAYAQPTPKFIALDATNAYWGVKNGIRYAPK